MAIPAIHIQPPVSRFTKFTKHVCSGMMLPLVLTACATPLPVGPDYVAPDATNVLPAAEWQAALPHEGQTHALTDWWKSFNDPVLDTLLTQAESDSPTLMEAMARIDEARAGLTFQKSSGAPTLQASAHLLRNNGSADLPTPVLTTRGTVLDAQWEIDLFGRVRRGNEAALARLESREQGWHVIRISLAAEVAGRYVDYRSCHRQLHALTTDATSRTLTERIMARAAETGLFAPAESELARASSAQSRSARIAQEAQCDLLRKSLVTLTGIPETKLRMLLHPAPVADAPSPALPTPIAFQVDELPVAWLAQRPDLAALERELAAASAEMGVATANRYPRLALIGNLTRDRSSDTHDGPSYLSKPWFFGPTLTLPLLDGGALAAQQDAASARYTRMLARYRQAVRSAVEEVEAALTQLDAARRRTENARIAATGYRSYFQSAEKNWRAGGLSLLGLEEARRSMLAAEATEITLQRDHVLAWIHLYKALGGGWSLNMNDTAAVDASSVSKVSNSPNSPKVSNAMNAASIHANHETHTATTAPPAGLTGATSDTPGHDGASS